MMPVDEALEKVSRPWRIPTNPETTLAAEVRRLREENERLRKDAERLDWLLSDFGKHCFSVDHAWDGESDLRPVIDAVRSTK